LNITSAYSSNLPFPNYVYRFVSPDCSTRCLETEEAECGVNSSFDEPMVLLDDIIEVVLRQDLVIIDIVDFFQPSATLYWYGGITIFAVLLFQSNIQRSMQFGS
jgi:hypothetical protein